MPRPLMTAVSFGVLVTAVQVAAQDVDTGAELYQHYCATCHGIDATGHGPMAGILVIQPVDLTKLAGEDGVFPTARVVARIDGRDPLVSHGSPMPVYGPYFDGQDTSMKTPEGQPILTSQPIVDLIAYLETLQGG
ncbi:c-type cytochrome [Ruegeria arenilitoris]|uniref:c-type cytochrome n=1 Tax=Ruegeria arenilitoris TaxID=1173585 RepID=UPI0014800DB8|nr:cytochrome c [Ruegeria arenilitoris]